MMRSLLLIAIGSLATAASAQSASVPTPLSTPWTNIHGYSGLAPTPSMIRMNQDRRAEGLAYLNGNAHSRVELVALADKCAKITAKPAYCAIPQMQQLAEPRVQIAYLRGQ